MASFSGDGLSTIKPTSFICRTCHSTEFYEDQQGGYICKVCSMQSQDFIAESNELYEEAGLADPSANKWKRLSSGTPRRKGVSSSAANNRNNNPELFEFLKFYQVVLQLMMKSAMKVLFDEDDDYEQHKAIELEKVKNAQMEAIEREIAKFDSVDDRKPPSSSFKTPKAKKDLHLLSSKSRNEDDSNEDHDNDIKYEDDENDNKERGASNRLRASKRRQTKLFSYYEGGDEDDHDSYDNSDDDSYKPVVDSGSDTEQENSKTKVTNVKTGPSKISSKEAYRDLKESQRKMKEAYKLEESQREMKELHKLELKVKLMTRLKFVWSKFLDAWRTSNATCRMLDAFSKKSNTCSCAFGKFNHPLHPTKPMILGFIYLAIRMERLDIIPADLVRWCERGLIPYTNLWESTPEIFKSKISKSYRWILTSSHTGASNFVTTANIWFHTVSIAESISIDIPPLNAPLVALSIVKSLGLPDHVWELYCDLSQIFTLGTPMHGADSTDQQFGEYILALILLSCLLCDNVASWSLLYHQHYDERLQYDKEMTIKEQTESRNFGNYFEDENVENDLESNCKHFERVKLSALPNPVAFHELDQIPRKLLPLLLTQIRRCQSSYKVSNSSSRTSTSFKLNSTILEFLSSIKQTPCEDINEKSLIGLLDMGSKQDTSSQLFRSPVHHETPLSTLSGVQKQYMLDLKSFHSFSSRMKLVPVALCGEPIYQNYMSNTEKLYHRALDYHQRHRQKGFHTFISHSRHLDDITGLRPMIYTLMLERFARYGYVPPFVLHTIIESFDKQITEFVFKGKISNFSLNETVRNAARQKAIMKMSTKSQQQRSKHIRSKHYEKDLQNFSHYKKKCEVMLPLVRELGNSGLMPDLDTEEWNLNENDGSETVQDEAYWNEVEPEVTHATKKRKVEILAQFYEFHDWWTDMNETEVPPVEAVEHFEHMEMDVGDKEISIEENIEELGVDSSSSSESEIEMFLRSPRKPTSAVENEVLVQDKVKVVEDVVEVEVSKTIEEAAVAEKGDKGDADEVEDEVEYSEESSEYEDDGDGDSDYED